jgi:MFS family permease
VRSAKTNQPRHDTASALMAQRPAMSRGPTLLFAVAGGAAVGNLYWAQPLLDFIARDLHVSTAAAPSFGVFLLAISVLGLTTVSGQILSPLAGDLADDAHRGRAVGTVVSGILTGILVSRTISGLVAGAAGWRTVFAAAAAADVLLAILLYRAIPPLPPKTRMPYPALIASVGAMVRRKRTVRWTRVLGATAFGVFTMFWTALTFLFSAPPFSYPVSVIGLFGLAGLAGAIMAQRAGRLHDRGWSLPATGAGVGPGPRRLSWWRPSRATPSQVCSSRSSSSTSPSKA